MAKKQIPVDQLLASIRRGSRVTILRPNGIGRNGQEWKEATGVCVIPPDNQGQDVAVLDMGGEHGTPGVADDRNLVRVGKREAFYDESKGQQRCDQPQMVH